MKNKSIGHIVAVTVLSSTGFAAAQDAGSAVSVPQANVAPGEEAGGRVEEIVVTAQRRSENVQKSSISIQAISSNTLVREGISEARDLTTIAPSLTIAQNGAFTQTNVRGAGDVATNALAQPAVSYSVDGVVYGQSLGVSSNMYDLARVEILKGPQGTLYGRNATGGAVNIITNRPRDEFEGYLTGELGNYSLKHLTGAVNVPLSTTLAVRTAFDVVDRDGYLSDGTDDDVRQSARIQALWKPADGFDVRLSGDYSHTGGKGGGVVLLPSQPGTGKWTSASDPINNAALAAGTLGLHVPIEDDAFIDMDQWNTSAEINVDLGSFATLTVIPAYRNLEMHQVTYNYSARASYDPQITDQYSLEARLSNHTDTLKWVLGGFFYDSPTYFNLTTKALSDPVLLPVFFVTANIHTTNRSYAGFGEATYSLTDSLRVIGGQRYTVDQVSFSGSLIDNGAVPNPASPYPQFGKKDFYSYTWKAGLEYDVAPESMLFFTASKGYKSGGFFYVPGGNDNSFAPEQLLAFDLGLRNRFFDDKLQLNLEAYYYKYTNQQIPSAGFTSTGSIDYNTRNAGSSTPRGAEIDVVYKPTDHDTISFNAAYVDAKYDDFTIDFPAPLIATIKGRTGCGIPAAPTVSQGLPVYLVDCSGKPLARTPEWSGSFGYEHVMPLDLNKDLALNFNGTWASSRYLSSDLYTPESKTGGYVLLNASATLTLAEAGLTFTGYVRNITNEAVYQGGIADIINGFPALFGVQGTPTFFEATVGAPRTFGVRATYRF